MGPPPPMMYGPPRPIFVRRMRRRSHSSDKSNSSRESSPKNNTEETQQKTVNGDADSESSISNYRPKTPPRDYDVPNDKRNERMSRRDNYERRQRRHASPRHSPTRMYGGYGPPYGAYAFGPYGHPMYPPYMNPMMARSRSVPPQNRYPPTSGKHKKGKKGKKSKKHAKDQSSDVGYTSEIPYGMYGPPPAGPYDFSMSRRPRDFRREENQFLNEKSFSHRIQEESRKSKGEYYPTAYELNDALGEDRNAKEGDFNLY